MNGTAAWCAVLIIEVGALLKLFCILASLCRSKSVSFEAIAARCRNYRAQLCKWWKEKHVATDSRSERELDKLRCTWTRILWCAIFGSSLLNILVQQISALCGEDLGELDGFVLVAAAFGLMITAFPCLMTPRSQDLWYVVTVVSLNAVFLVSEQVDIRDLLSFTAAGRFMLGVLAKRTWCVILCILIDLLTAMTYPGPSNMTSEVSYPVQALPVLFSVFLLCIVGVRRLMRENVVLKVDLQKRTVEMGAVSSLLTACYDAVVEVDEGFRLTHDSNQLSSMLLYTQQAGDLSGRSLLDFFTENDRARISELFLSATAKSLSVMALNADMLDSDFNQVKVELFCVQFHNLADEQCFLVALREMQDLDPGHVPPPSVPSVPSVTSPLSQGSPTGPKFMVVFDVFTFDIHLADGKMEQICEASKGERPESILDLASDDSRLFLSHQLQSLGNQIGDSQQKPEEDYTVTFNFLSLGEAFATVSVEQDQVLNSWTGTMAIYLKGKSSTSNLTISDLGRLPSTGTLGARSHPRLPLRRSSRPASSARSSRSRGSGSPSHRGTISDLHQPGRSIAL